MTARGAQKHNAKGRSIGERNVRSDVATIKEPFVMRPIEMLGSPAFRVLSLSGHRLLARVEIEHVKHYGGKNGELIVTYQDFEMFGVRKDSIASAIRETKALGLLDVEPGSGGNAEWRAVSFYRLTYLHTANMPASHDWRRIKTMPEAKAIAAKARKKA